MDLRPSCDASRTDASSRRREPSLFYAPPYDRTVEDEMAWHLVKYLRPECGLTSQERIETVAGPSWVDFVVELVDDDGRLRRVGIEITSATETASGVALPLCDAVLVGSGALDALYRVSEDSVLHRLHDVLAVVSECDADLFTDRAHVVFERLADPVVCTLAIGGSGEGGIHVPPVVSSEESALWGSPVCGPDGFTVTRLDRRLPSTWLADYTRATRLLGRVGKAA